MIQAKTLIQRIEQLAPLAIKEAKDPSGLQIGDPEQMIHKVMVTLDVRPEVVAEAIEQDIDFIFAHHPIMFHPAHNLDTRDPQNKMYADLLKHDIVVYAAHTNLDKALGGMNDWLATALGLQNIQALPSETPAALDKLVVFVPIAQAETMRQALSAAGAGTMGNYSQTSYTMAGQGRFLPNEQAHPAVGQKGQLETTQESRIEVLVPHYLLPQVVTAMLAAHPYEVPAYDIIPLRNQATNISLGRIGQLPQALSVLDFAKQIKQTFNLTGLRIVSHDRQRHVQNIAVVAGDGCKFYPSALKAGADLLVTGDIYYHTAHDMLANGLDAIDPGHHIESIVKTKMTAQIQDWAQTNHWAITVQPSELSTEPFYFI